MKSVDLFLFIGKCLTMDFDPGAKKSVERDLANSMVPLKPFLEMGISQSLIPALYSAFNRNEILPLLPPGFTSLLEQIYSMNLRKNVRIIEQVNEINNIFKKEGIQPVFLKGAGYLLQKLYFDQGDRMMLDIDILVRETDFRKSAGIMLNNGYFHTESSQEDDYSEHRHLPPFIHPDKALPVEIHRYPLPLKYPAILPAKEAFTESRKIEGTDAWVLSARHQQIHLFFHELLHTNGKLSSLGTLRGLNDFYLLSKLRNPEKNDISGLSARKKYLRYCCAVRVVFNSQDVSQCFQKAGEKRFLRREFFLINHPCIDTLYFHIVYRPFYILGLTFKSPFSTPARRLLFKKMSRFLLPFYLLRAPLKRMLKSARKK